jgi:hypothetical protein
LTPPFDRIPAVRIGYNVGCLIDIPTGQYVFGKYGESICTGGNQACTGIVGIGNNFKSTFMHYLQGAALARYAGSNGMTFDTEINLTEARVIQMTSYIDGFTPTNNPIVNGTWTISDKASYFGNQWFDKYKEYVKFKADNAAKIKATTPFLDRDGSFMTVLRPTFTQIDSLTEFETEDVAEMKDENSLGDKGANTIFMRQGLSKTSMLMQFPKLIAAGNTPLFLTAHIGKLIGMDPHAPPPKKLQFLKNGDTMKGVTDKFSFLTTVCWQCQNASPLLNDGTKAPEYPNGPGDDMKMDTDLMSVTLSMLRNKYGRSGLQMVIIISQEQGVLPSLSEFHYIKTVDKFGFEGNNINYNLVLCPEIKLGRTTVRPKIDKHPELRRALNILAEMCQIQQLWTDNEGLFCTPKQLYDDLIAMGYDWTTLLNTRGWWTFDNDKQPVPFLSTMDLMRMRKGLYTPYWWDTKAKPIDLSKAAK